MLAPKAAAAATSGMTTGQLTTLLVIAVLFIGLALYVFVIRPRRQRGVGPTAPRRPLGKAAPERDEGAEEEPFEDPDVVLARAREEAARAQKAKQEAGVRARTAAAEAARARADADGPAASAKEKVAKEAESRRVQAEADFRRRDAEERRRRAEEDKRRAEDDAARRRAEEAERKRKSEEERKRKRDEEERIKAEAEAKRNAEEAAKRAAEEAERARRESANAEKRERLRSLREGLGKTRDEGFVGRIGGLLGRKAFDDQLVADLEEIMFTADIGVKTAESLFARVREGLSRKELHDPAAVFRCLRDEAARILDAADAAPVPVESAKPYVIMVVGVNGSGKTTTIGKLAAQYRAAGRSVVVGAGDTFRAAAAEQLAVWADRVGVPIVRKHEGADPSSVLFEAVNEGKRLGADIVIADTAGRLQTKAPLMEELRKIHRVLGKGADGAPHEVLLVLDSTNGQNAISQAKLFNEALKLTGIVMTKLDGTAKGGVILGIVDEMKIPVRYIGIGESVEDLRLFDKADFLDALFEIREGDLMT